MMIVEIYLGLVILDKSRSKTVGQLMEQNIVEEGFAAEMNQLFLVHELLRDGGENLRELVGYLVLEHHHLGSLLLADPLIVGEVEGQGLDRLSGVPGGED